MLFNFTTNALMDIKYIKMDIIRPYTFHNSKITRTHHLLSPKFTLNQHKTIQKSLPNIKKLNKIKSMNYKEAGVDIEAGTELINRIKKLNPEIGGFSGLYPFGKLLFKKYKLK